MPMLSRPRAVPLPILALTLVLLGAAGGTSTALATPVFVDSGQVFGPKKGHFGRCNAWGDLDGNGLYDLVTGSHDGGLLAYSQDSPLVFRRVETEIGLGSYDRALYGVLLLDFDRDGDPDLVLNQIGFDFADGLPSLRYLKNDGTGHFGDWTSAVGFDETDRGFGMAALDFDRDGWVDLYALHHGAANTLYRNLGDGSFQDVTLSAGVGAEDGRQGQSTGVATLDYDRDGWVDLFVTQRDPLSPEHPRGNNKLYRNRGDGTFEERAVEAGLCGYSHDFVVSSHDIDADGWMDLYIGTFNFAPAGTPTTDYRNRTYLNQGDGTFLDVSLVGGADYIGGTMGLAVGDGDNDGDPDLYVGTGGPYEAQIENQIYYQGRGDGGFGDRTATAGLIEDARGHGSTWFDVDRDGDLDIYASLGGLTVGAEHRDILYLNQGPVGHFLEVMARGRDCPREGLGAAVECFFEGRSLRREVGATAGFDSQAPPHAWFGLGAATTVDSVVVEWPCGRRQALRDVSADEHRLVEEPSGQVPIRDLEILAMRDASGGVQLRVGPVDDLLAASPMELWRRVGSADWSRRPVVWTRQGSELSTVDGGVPRDRDVGYLVRIQRQPGAPSAWLERKTSIAGLVLRLDVGANPFRGRLTVRAEGVSPSARLRIYDLRGRMVRRLNWSDAAASGNAVSWVWDGRDATGRAVATGSYVLDLQDGTARLQRSVWRSPD